MKIVIVGAGRVGQSVAEALVSERNDITVVDQDPLPLRALQDRLDLRGVTGNGIHASVLSAAGIEDADLLVACAPLDETNLVVCKIAHDVFSVPKTIARLRSPEFADGGPLLGDTGFAVDRVICPEQSVTTLLLRLIEHPEALQVLHFAGGLLSLVVVRAVADSALTSHTLGEIPRLLPNAALRIVAIYRGGQALVALDGATRIEPGDEVFVLSATEHTRAVLQALHAGAPVVRRVVIAGGGKVGLRLARQIQGTHRVKIIEPDRARCEYLATALDSRVLVLQGDCTDEELLGDEQIGGVDLFLAVTSDDEDNIMGCLLAKRLGARRVLALVNRNAYADLVQGTRIDIAISPSQAVLGELLTFVRRGDVQAVHSLRRGAAEAMEVVVRGDRRSCPLAGRRIDEVKLPAGTQFGAIVRGLHGADGDAAGTAARPQVLLAHHDTVIEPNDHVVVFVPNKRLVREVERLFQVSATFFG